MPAGGVQKTGTAAAGSVTPRAITPCHRAVTHIYAGAWPIAIFARANHLDGTAMSPNTLLTLVAVVGGFLITAAGAIATWAALRTGRQAAVLSNLKEAADAATRLATVRKDEISEQQRHIDQLEKASIDKDKLIANLSGRVQQLSDLVTGRPAWDQLSATLALITQQTDARVAEALAQADQIRADIRAVRELVESNAALIAASKEQGHGRGPRQPAG